MNKIVCLAFDLTMKRVAMCVVLAKCLSGSVLTKHLK